MSKTSDDGVFIIFGATGGIGSALASLLRSQGREVVVAGRDGDRLDELAAASGAHPHRMGDQIAPSIQACIDAAMENHGKVSGVANCIGSLLLKPAHLTTDADWESVIDTNLGSAFATVRACGKAMTKTGGSVVLVSSAAAEVGMASHEGIAAAKAGIVGLMRAAAATYAGRGIRFNAVSPGLVETPLTSRLTSNEQMKNASSV